MCIRLYSALLSGAIGLISSLCASAATPANVTASAAVSYEVGQGWVSHYISEANQNRWFKFTSTGGRGYCLEAAQGSDTHVALNPNLTVYSDINGTATMGSNDNGGFEPTMTLGSRYCFVDTSTLDTRTVRTVKVNVPITAGSGDDGYVRLRIYDTTVVGRYNWAIGNPNGSSNVYGSIDVHNNGATAVTVYYQARGSCVSWGSTCPSNPSGSVVVQPRSSTSIAAYGWGNTTGNAIVTVAVAAPLTDVRIFAVTGGSGSLLTAASNLVPSPPATSTFDVASVLVSKTALIAALALR